jgi:nucleoside-diphosphate-sugar epimerase
MAELLLTGAAGFLGHAIRRQYQGSEIFPVDTQATESGVMTVDLLDPYFEKHLPDQIGSVIHLAALSSDRACRASPLTAWELNLNATLKLYAACAARGCQKFVFASSEWIYGDQSSARAWREEDRVSPAGLGVYALSKLTAEYALQQVAQPSCDLVIYRLAILYGPRTAGLSAVESIAYQVARNEKVEVNSGATARCYLHVEDAAAAMLQGTQSDLKGVYNVSGGMLFTLRDVYDVAGRLTGNRPGFHERDTGATTVRNIDGSKLARELGFRPRRFQQGLEDLLELHSQAVSGGF